MLLLTESAVHTRKYLFWRHAVRTERSEVRAAWRHNKYFPYGPNSRLIRALLYTTTKSQGFPLLLWTEVQPVHTPVRTQAYGPALSQSNFSIPSVFCLVYNNMLLLTESAVHTRKYLLWRHAVRTERSEVLSAWRHNKYFPYGPNSRSVRALLYSHTSKTTEVSVFLCYYGLKFSQSIRQSARRRMDRLSVNQILAFYPYFVWYTIMVK